MIKFLHRVFKNVIAIEVFAVSFLIVAACVNQSLYNDLVMVFRMQKWTLLSCGFIMFFSNLIFILSDFKKVKNSDAISIEGENGVITISAQAICNYIIKLQPEFPTIMKLQPKVVAKKRYIDILVFVRVKPDPQIHEACEVLQKRIRDTLANALGILEVRKIEISIREISGRYHDMI